MRSCRRSEAEWRGLLAGWRSSGQAMSRYAREHGVPANSLAYWAKRDSSESLRMVRVHTDAPAAEAEVTVTVGGAVLRTSTSASAEWMALLEAHDMICAPVFDYEDILADEQALANEYVLSVDHPTNGETQVVGFPWKFSATPAAAAPAAPELGAHTEEILLSVGYSWDEITALRDAGAI